MAARVREFTALSGAATPDRPSPMNKDEVKFLIRMCTSELVELAQTVTNSAEEAMVMVRDAVGTDVKESELPNNPVAVIAGQADAAVDTWIYILNAFAKKGVNLDPVFDEVHRANMDKRFPDGTFHRREDGKIIKPPEFVEADVKKVIRKQLADGAW
jgi:predicted HAD superfamily Cof-like phosphohydrolase